MTKGYLRNSLIKTCEEFKYKFYFRREMEAAEKLKYFSQTFIAKVHPVYPTFEEYLWAEDSDVLEVHSSVMEYLREEGLVFSLELINDSIHPVGEESFLGNLLFLYYSSKAGIAEVIYRREDMNFIDISVITSEENFLDGLERKLGQLGFKREVKKTLELTQTNR